MSTQIIFHNRYFIRIGIKFFYNLPYNSGIGEAVMIILYPYLSATGQWFYQHIKVSDPFSSVFVIYMLHPLAIHKALPAFANKLLR